MGTGDDRVRRDGESSGDKTAVYERNKEIDKETQR